MEEVEETLELHQLDSLDCPFHQHLLRALGHLCEDLQELVQQAEGRGQEGEELELLKGGVWEVIDSYHLSMSGLHTFLAGLERQTHTLDQHLALLDRKRLELLEERDELIERGHELNCRIGYNALERKLEETFTSTEKYTTMESARCFKDEAEEDLRRCNDVIRTGCMRACQIDRDLFDEMEKITDLFENYERDREHYVKELDLFADVRRIRISSWLAEGREEGDRERGENVLDYLNLTEKQRHMEPQVIKNALRMYSFNASMTFDREDNQKHLEELTSVQSQVNSVSGLSLVVPRWAVGRTNLTEDVEWGRASEEGAESDDVTADHGTAGRGLHKCPRSLHLATEPVTESETVGRLDVALRWAEPDVGSPAHQEADSSLSDVPDPALAFSSSSSSQDEVKVMTSTCGDVPSVMALETGADVRGVVKDPETAHPERTSGSSTQNLLQHMESCTLIPAGAGKHMAGLVRRKKPSGRPVGSLTSVVDTDTQGSGHKLAAGESQERVTRSQGSEPSTRATTSGNKSREHVMSWDKD
ncbi:uncharacterized protein LOC101845345 [Aplysia californica]|uniref:Uncharacterized protein LOC101845345 n=1 Tax=Aplysia californica TaxID=6500 RepID=A0ABM1A558_APLCA|nr:uncharacterized protein LOC101845345 [Aplysia californica]